MKRVAIISDLHCGHQLGLCQQPHSDRPFSRERTELWRWFENEVNEVNNSGKVDILFVNGDAIDGDGWRSGGTELLTTDRGLQCQIAKEAIELFNATRIVIIEGTSYHTGSKEPWERTLAEKLGCEFYEEGKFDIEGVIFDIRHFTSRSSIPHGRATPALKSMMWADINAARERKKGNVEGAVDVNVIIRSHVHNWGHYQDASGLVIITPCLQMNSRFGSKICTGTPDLGFITMNIGGRDDIVVGWHLMPYNPASKPPVVL